MQEQSQGATLGEPAFPKPKREPKKRRQLRQVSAKRAARIAAGEPAMKRSRIKPKPPRRLASEDAGRMEFARAGVCVGKLYFPGHVCRGDVQASHERNPMGGLPTGMGRKENARGTCSMCAWLHLECWEKHAGPFAGWPNEVRHAFMEAACAALNAEWDALSPEQREWWQERAAIAKKQRAEAMRGAGL